MKIMTLPEYKEMTAKEVLFEEKMDGCRVVMYINEGDGYCVDAIDDEAEGVFYRKIFLKGYYESAKKCFDGLL